MGSIVLNGEQLTFTPRQTILQVATAQKIDIPYYCWHPRLSVAANCRMCLVEIEKMPKLVPSCQTECKDGMVVHANSARVQAAQASVHEFLLINHPIDCPICDQAGECKLQDYYMKYQLRPSRMQVSKVAKPKRVVLGPQVVLNSERCIVCTRCVRFMSEIAHDPQLGVFGRGDHAHIGVAPGKQLDNPYSLNTVDICPVGALTSKAFRFKQRVWNLSRGKSLCSGCARGCNVYVDHRGGQVYRLMPRENADVNQSWLCDEGRLTYQRANQPLLTQVWVRQASGLQPVKADEALAMLQQPLQKISEATTATERGLLATQRPVVAILSLSATCEEAFAFLTLLLQLGGDQVALLGYNDGEGDNWLRERDKNPNRAGILAVLSAFSLREVGLEDVAAQVRSQVASLLLVCGLHGDSEGLDLGAALPLDQAEHPATLRVVFHSEEHRLLDAAHVVLPTLRWVEKNGTWLNSQGRGQRLFATLSAEPPRQSTELWIHRLQQQLGLPCSGVDAWAEAVPQRLGWHIAHTAALGDMGMLIAPTTSVQAG